MRGFNWIYDFDPQFVLHIFPFEVVGNRDCLHWHRYCEIGLCTGGSGKFVYLNKTYPVEPGDIFVSNNYETHVAISQSLSEKTNYLFLIFLPSYFSQHGLTQLSQQYLRIFNYLPLQFQNRIPACSPEAGNIAEYMQKAWAAYKSRQDNFHIVVDIKFRCIVLELIHFYTSLNDGINQSSVPIDPRILAIQEYINNHFQEKITTKTISEKLNISPTYFRHLFTNQLGISFKSYLTHVRMAQARKLLIATDINIIDVIMECGFTNANHFYQLFFDLTNMTPADFRKNNSYHRYKEIDEDEQKKGFAS